MVAVAIAKTQWSLTPSLRVAAFSHRNKIGQPVLVDADLKTKLCKHGETSSTIRTWLQLEAQARAEGKDPPSRGTSKCDCRSTHGLQNHTDTEPVEPRPRVCTTCWRRRAPKRSPCRACKSRPTAWANATPFFRSTAMSSAAPTAISFLPSQGRYGHALLKGGARQVWLLPDPARPRVNHPAGLHRRQQRGVKSYFRGRRRRARRRARPRRPHRHSLYMSSSE